MTHRDSRFEPQNYAKNMVNICTIFFPRKSRRTRVLQSDPGAWPVQRHQHCINEHKNHRWRWLQCQRLQERCSMETLSYFRNSIMTHKNSLVWRSSFIYIYLCRMRFTVTVPGRQGGEILQPISVKNAPEIFRIKWVVSEHHIILRLYVSFDISTWKN